MWHSATAQYRTSYIFPHMLFLTPPTSHVMLASPTGHVMLAPPTSHVMLAPPTSHVMLALPISHVMLVIVPILCLQRKVLRTSVGHQRTVPSAQRLSSFNTWTSFDFLTCFPDLTQLPICKVF